MCISIYIFISRRQQQLFAMVLVSADSALSSWRCWWVLKLWWTSACCGLHSVRGELLADFVCSAEHRGCSGITGMKWTQRKRRWFCIMWSETSGVLRVVEGTSWWTTAGCRAWRMELYSQTFRALCWTNQHIEIAELSGTKWKFLAAFQRALRELPWEGLQEVAQQKGVCLAWFFFYSEGKAHFFWGV